MKATTIILALILSATWTHIASARPGGGHSSAGHSVTHTSDSTPFSFHSNGSGFSTNNSNQSYSSMDSHERMLVLLVFVLVIIVIIFFVLRNQSPAQTFTARPTEINRVRQKSTIAAALTLLKQSDPNFSLILFLDFVHSLYSKFYSYSTHPEFSYLSPFLSTELQKHFQQENPWDIDEIVINGLNLLEINTQGADTESISLLIDANYTLHRQNKRNRYAISERWLFYRQTGLLSSEPEKMQTLSCPFCAAPAHFTDAGECQHCGNQVQKGAQQWYLGKRVVLKTTELDANDLVAYAVEQGTQLPTIKQENLAAEIQTWLQLHAISNWADFWQPFETDIVKGYFLTIYTEWSQRNWSAVRHLLSDRLYEANSFWLNLYTEHNWFNRLENLTIDRVELVKIDTDKFYEAITVRIIAACYDYTEDANGKVLGGSKRNIRHYSEYWTFVRRTGIERHTAQYSLKQCPSCGAPADNMGQTSECGYCGSKISSGAFSWVLFLIMQDEVYDG